MVNGKRYIGKLLMMAELLLLLARQMNEANFQAGPDGNLVLMAYEKTIGRNDSSPKRSLPPIFF